MKIFRERKHTLRIFTASVLAAVTILNLFPATASADPPPVDLTLNNEGYTPIIVNNIRPGDSGTKTIELHNAGSKDGHVTIWLSDVVNGEGLNPESETGDTSGDGEMDVWFTLDLTVDGLDSTLNLPVTVQDFPRSAVDVDYIKIIPLKAGETISLEWQWALPIEAGNDVQGDELSFTINYTLQESAITDVSSSVSANGSFLNDVTVYSENKHGKVVIAANTTGKTADNQTPTEIWIIELPNEAPSTTGDTVKTGLYYDAGPDGTVFDKPIVITLNYTPENIPEGVNELELYIAHYDETLKRWVPVPGSVVDTSAKTVSAEISHFSRYTVLSRVPVTPTPSTPPVYYPPAEEEEDTEEPEQEPELVEVEVNLLDQESVVMINEDGTVDESFILEDADGNFIIEITAGSRLTAEDGTPLGRIELDTSDIYVTLPDNTIVLTPVYRLTGYDSEGFPTGISFDPSAVLKIRYNPEDLPDDSFLPYIARYSDETGIVALDLPSDSFVNLGWSIAAIETGGLFLIAVEQAPPQLPLPAHFTAGNLIIDPLETTEGDTARISVTVTNDGEESGSYELYLIIDGIVRSIKEISLNPRSSETLTFEVSNLAAGSHLIEVAHLSGTINVKRAEVTPIGSTVNWLVIDLSVAGGVIFGLLIWFLIARRLRQRARNSLNF